MGVTMLPQKLIYKKPAGGGRRWAGFGTISQLLVYSPELAGVLGLGLVPQKGEDSAL